MFSKIPAPVFVAFLALIFTFSIDGQSKPRRYIAVTIDDLPVVSTRTDLKNRQEITKKLLAHVTKAKVPAVGFVNENKLYTNNRSDDRKRDEPQIDLLRSWTAAGLELGNHTFYHNSLNRTDLKQYQNEILLGEAVTKELMKEKNKPVRYFRHPYLHTGLSMEVKTGLNTAYIPYMNAKMDYWERQSVKIFGREIKQIFLMHANFINSDYFDDLAQMLKARGYKFVTLENALKDEAYKLPDNFVRNNGISWLHRWALDKGKENVLPDEPKVPEFVLKAAGMDSE
jgi:peptidoglycan/xylan/chitin deacetylase (PgdA/CDA1 family)